MKYIIMCGGNYEAWETPRHLTEVYGEPIVARTIRLLRECGVTDISISSNHEAFNNFGVPVLHHDNNYTAIEYNNYIGYWCDGIYPTDEPTTYIFGDVIFSPEAIRTIVDYQVDDIMLFGSKWPFVPEYPKWFIEPFAFKVIDTDLLKWAVKEVKRLDKIGAFHRRPIAWELWNVAKGGDPNNINNDYVAINDYTCDIDKPNESDFVISRVKGGNTMAEKKTETKKTTTKKTTKKAAPKKPATDTATYKGLTYMVLERTDDKYLLTDGAIHFWVKAKDVTA